MKIVYLKIELIFEKLTSMGTKVLGNPITFMLAVILVLFWWSTSLFTTDDYHQNIGDFIFGTTFLSLFIIQKSFNHFSALIHLKMNELISSHEFANNAVIDTSEKTEKEIRELSKEYIEVEDEIENKHENEIKDEITKQENVKNKS